MLSCGRTVANAIGMALGLLTVVQTVMFLTFGFDFAVHWSHEAIEAKRAVVGPEYAERVLRIGLVIGLPTRLQPPAEGPQLTK